MDSRCGQHGGGSNTGLRVEMSGHTWEALQVETRGGHRGVLVVLHSVRRSLS